MIPTVGSLLINGLRNNAVYYVVSIVHHTTYALLLRVQCQLQGCRHPLSWPSIDWKISVLNGAEDQPSKVDYRDCHVPRSVHMIRYLHQTIRHMIFSYLSPVHGQTIHPNYVDGLIDSHETKKGHYQPAIDLDHNFLRIYGDYL